MGRTTGFLSGITLTTGILYFSLLTHQRNRITQAQLLRQQSLLLNSVLDPDIVPVEDAPRFVAQRVNWTETWKDRWNADVEGAVRWCQRIRWEDVWGAAKARIRDIGVGERRA